MSTRIAAPGDEGAAGAASSLGPDDRAGGLQGLRREDRLAATLAMLSFILFSVVGQLLVLRWARRHRSTFALRYTEASLVLEGVVLVMLVPVCVAFFTLSSSVELLLLIVIGWLVELVLVALAVLLALRAWRGHDVASGPLPSWFTDRLSAG